MSDTQLEIKRAAQLSITEIGVGSIGHGFKIPLTGQVLSLNQLGFLLNAVNRDHLKKSAVFEISGIAAILKSFSPAGQKIGPMLSIAMQGFLFWLSLSVFGIGVVGQSIGAVFLSLWAFIQPFITLFLIYGFDLTKLVEFYSEKIRSDYSFLALTLLYGFILILVVKLIAALTLVVLSRFYGKNIKIVSIPKVETMVIQQVSNQSGSALVGAIKDLTKPLFLLSFTLILIFLWQMNGSLGQKIWMGLRPLAIAFIIFYLLRSPWVAIKLLDWSKKSNWFNKIYLKTQKAFEMIKSHIVN